MKECSNKGDNSTLVETVFGGAEQAGESDVVAPPLGGHALLDRSINNSI